MQDSDLLGDGQLLKRVLKEGDGESWQNHLQHPPVCFYCFIVCLFFFFFGGGSMFCHPLL